eukprot:TRINITY_DN6097_c0_g1_i1.p1 TRINITY_DN6097_c0_g1~~TRINITY_DN6097_c0_g1_i1.p1  ORF type:complete len:491 (-),score=55.15 TRINITY_DN6097_c0_g1_i1:726-2198(-)
MVGRGMEEYYHQNQQSSWTGNAAIPTTLAAGYQAGYPQLNLQSLRQVPPRLENGNWLCTECRNVNYARREICNRCQTPRSGSYPSDFAEQPGNHISAASITFGIDPTDDYPQMPQDINLIPSPIKDPRMYKFFDDLFASSTQPSSNENSTGLGSLLSGSVHGLGAVRNLWSDNHADTDALIGAFESSLVLSEPKSENVPQPKTGPKAGVDGNWMCVDTTCRNVNYPRRKYCNRCGRQRTMEQDEVAEAYFRRVSLVRQQNQWSTPLPYQPGKVSPSSGSESSRSIWIEADANGQPLMPLHAPSSLSGPRVDTSPSLPSSTAFSSFFSAHQSTNSSPTWPSSATVDSFYDQNSATGHMVSQGPHYQAQAQAQPHHQPSSLQSQNRASTSSVHHSQAQEYYNSQPTHLQTPSHRTMSMQYPYTLSAEGHSQYLHPHLHSMPHHLAHPTRPGAPATYEVNKHPTDGNWICPECNNLNYPRRVVCNRCSRPRYL